MNILQLGCKLTFTDAAKYGFGLFFSLMKIKNKTGNNNVSNLLSFKTRLALSLNNIALYCIQYCKRICVRN